MYSSIRLFLISIAVICIIAVEFFFIANSSTMVSEQSTQTAGSATSAVEPQIDESAALEEAVASTTPTPSGASDIHETTITPKQDAVAPVTPKKEAKPVPKEDPDAQKSTEVVRVQEPYTTPPQTFLTVNDETRSALVNILCAARNGSLRPVSGSGVIIDPRGVILTNAHVAQYVLLASDTRVDLSCVIRSGSPARPHWSAEVLYMPAIWVREHVSDINTEHPLGTGEHDYALLRINSALIGSQFPTSFPYLSPDTREAIGFVDDLVLAASYPAEFIGGITAQLSLYPASSITTIKGLLTFDTSTIDVVSIGGVIGAQNGSSGGALVNAWGRLIGVITTTSEGDTTADRDLRSITLSYINRDLSIQSGFDLSTTLDGNIEAKAFAFNKNEAPKLIQLLVDQISERSR